jgi:hypothetical protein
VLPSSVRVLSLTWRLYTNVRHLSSTFGHFRADSVRFWAFVPTARQKKTYDPIGIAGVSDAGITLGLQNHARVEFHDLPDERNAPYIEGGIVRVVREKGRLAVYERVPLDGQFVLCRPY